MLRLSLCLLPALLATACADATKSDPGTDGPTPPASDSGGADSGDGDSGARDCAPVDPAPPDTPEGHPADGWAWEKGGPLFEDTVALNYTDGDLAPSLVDTGTELVLLFARKRGTEQGLFVTTSPDGADWSAPEAVMGIDAGSIEYPSLVFADGVFHLWHGSGSIAYASSTDGRTFTPGDTVLRVGEAGAFDSLSLLYPHAVLTEDGAQLFYTGFDGARFAIGATEPAAPGAELASGTVLLERATGTWDNTSVGMPEVLVDSTGQTRFWYGGYDTDIADPGPWRIGLWDAETGSRTVSLPLAESGLDAWSTRDPAVIPRGSGWFMVYVGMGDDGVYRLMRASSAVCN